MSLVSSMLTPLLFLLDYAQGGDIICDGTTTICVGQTMTCIDDEACSIQCTGGTGGCIGSTFNCPSNGDCTVTCTSGVNNGGCASLTINAFDSLSLTVDNRQDNVRDAFINSNITCPFEGTCSLLSGGQNRMPFANVNIYSIFGFALNQVSVACTQGDTCKQQITMNCLDGYTSSCTLDATTGSSCAAASVCDTVFTTITGTWTDDYLLDHATGWIVRNGTGAFIDNSTYTGSLATYHGPFYGDSDKAVPDIELNSMLRYFYCDTESNVYVEYYFSYSCAETTDYSALFINGVSVANKTAETATGEGFQDANLETYIKDRCPDAWHRKKMNGTSTVIAAGNVVKVQIDIAMNFVNESAFINAVQISCVAVTPAPTTSAPTQPTTPAPTTPMPTTARPTLNPTQPTADPTIRPTTNTAAPTQRPTAVTASPTQPTEMNTPDRFNIGSEQDIQSLHSTDVNTDALWIAILFIVGTCFIGVLVACHVWRKHEKEYGPIFRQRREQMMQTRQQMAGSMSQDSPAVVAEYTKGSDCENAMLLSLSETDKTSARGIMAVADPDLPAWFKANGFEEYANILTQELGVEEYDDFRLLRDERDVNELLQDMAALKPMNDAFQSKFKAEILRIVHSERPRKRVRAKPRSPGSSSSSSSNEASSSMPSLQPIKMSKSRPERPSSGRSNASSKSSTSTRSSEDDEPLKPLKISKASSHGTVTHKKFRHLGFLCYPQSRSSLEIKRKQKPKSVSPRPNLSKSPTSSLKRSVTSSKISSPSKSVSKSKLKSPSGSPRSKEDTYDLNSISSSLDYNKSRALKKSHSTREVASKSRASKSTSLSLLERKKSSKSSSGRLTKAQKEEKNKARGGFTIHSNRRVRLDDGRIGIVKYKGRTAFGKSGEDWIGIMVEYGKGQHNGTVNGRSYFKCRDGKGVMVRPDRIIEDLGNPNTKVLDDEMKKGSEEIQALLKEIAKKRKEERLRKKREAELAALEKERSNYSGDVGWTPAKFDDYTPDQSTGMFKQKLIHSKTLLDKHKDEKADKKKKVSEV